MPETENKENISTEQSVKADGSRQVYELGYLLVPTISEENTSVVFGNLKEAVAEKGAEIISSEMPRMMHLAYVMSKVIDNVKHKFDSAYFGWLKFETEPGEIAGLKKQLDLNQDLIRYLIIKTVRESTIAPKRFAGAGVGRFKASPDKKEEKPEEPMDKEKIDKEIDAMVEAA